MFRRFIMTIFSLYMKYLLSSYTKRTWATYIPEDDHYQAPKHVVVPYVENILYSTNKYSCVRPVHTLYISYSTEHNGDDEPYD